MTCLWAIASFVSSRNHARFQKQCWKMESGSSLGNSLLGNTYSRPGLKQVGTPVPHLGISGLVNLSALFHFAKENNIVLDLRMISRIKN